MSDLDTDDIVQYLQDGTECQMEWSEDGIHWDLTNKGARFYRWLHFGVEGSRYEKTYTASGKIEYRQISSVFGPNAVGDAICEMADAIRKHQA